MMSRFIAATFAIVVFVLLPQTSEAANYFSKYTVRAGKSALIGAYYGWNGRCRSSGYAKVKVLRKPRAGRVSVRRGQRYRIPKRAHAGKAGKCTGRKVRGVSVYYKAPRSFRGRVKLKIRAIAGDRRGRGTETITIRVVR